jgi:hypothetical protein
MPASNSRGEGPAPQPAEILRTTAWALASGRIGQTVRCTPRRWTVMGEDDGDMVFAKVRRGRRRDAAAEWRWLHELPRLGLAAPAPLWCGRVGRALLVAAVAAGEGALATRFAVRVVAPQVRRLHAAGIVFRDLYWNHLFARDLHADAVLFLDVERVFRPRCRRRRWIVKDLAGLLASAPAGLPRSAPLRFLLALLPRADRAAAPALARAVAAKAARIRAHVPKYG